jgi:hypothetical protein
MTVEAATDWMTVEAATDWMTVEAAPDWLTVEADLQVRLQPNARKIDPASDARKTCRHSRRLSIRQR